MRLLGMAGETLTLKSLIQVHCIRRQAKLLSETSFYNYKTCHAQVTKGTELLNVVYYNDQEFAPE